MKLFSILLLCTTAAASEFRERIVIVDTGIDSLNHIELCRDAHKDFTGTGLVDQVDHGTEVFRIASRGLNLGKYCVTVVKWTNSRNYSSISTLGFESMIKYIYSLHPVAVNFSSSGEGFNETEQMYLQNLVSEGAKIFVAAGNDNKDLSKECNIYPACYNITDSFFVVGATDSTGQRLPSSNYNGPVNAEALGVYQYQGKTYSGTSFATPAVLNRSLR